MSASKPNTEEAKAIKSLQRLARNWPKSLWLYSAGGSLCVMQKDRHGKKATLTNDGFDPSANLETINIENDGGDW